MTEREWAEADFRRIVDLRRDFPRIVVLCGSTRFKAEFEKATADETLKGHIVLSVGLFGHQMPGFDMAGEDKKKLDALHLRKIDLADEVVVISPHCPHCILCGRWYFNTGGEMLTKCACGAEDHGPNEPYVGPSTRCEINYATSKGKPIRYLNGE